MVWPKKKVNVDSRIIRISHVNKSEPLQRTLQHTHYNTLQHTLQVSTVTS